MSARLRIKDQHYEVPGVNVRINELRLIERLTGLTNMELRQRQLEQAQRLSALDEKEEIDNETFVGLLDDMVMVATVAKAIARANPTWTTEQVRSFVDSLDEDDVALEGGEEDPPELSAGNTSTESETSTAPAQQSSSDSDTDSSESTSPPSSGTPTSPTSPEEQSDQETWAA